MVIPVTEAVQAVQVVPPATGPFPLAQTKHPSAVQAVQLAPLLLQIHVKPENIMKLTYVPIVELIALLVLLMDVLFVLVETAQSQVVQLVLLVLLPLLE
jgi:hypothetical protein